MKQPSYRDRDYPFGQMMLSLRGALGLTQTGLADFLGVSRRSVVDWEAGSKYPKSEHLRQLIVLALERKAFPAGRELEDIRALWQAAHQKLLLDEKWIAGLLAAPPQAEAPPPPVSVPAIGSVSAPAPSRARLDWGDALSVPTFYGRDWELSLLTEWIVQDRCQVISVLGLGGIGKSSLVVRLMHQVADQFEVVIWRSLRDAPTCDALLDDCLQVIDPQALGQAPVNFEQRLSLLKDYLRSTRILLVLDNLEILLEEGEGLGHMRPGYEGYGRLLRQIAETQHQSCLLLTSREKVVDLVAQEGSRAPVRALHVARLDTEACGLLLSEKDVAGSEAERAQLIDAYTGNPLALKIVAQTIADLFEGEIAPFLEQGEVIFGGVRELLGEQFARLSPLEQSILLWLAILREPATLDALLTVLVRPATRGRLLEALERLRRRSLIERGQERRSFTLQSVVMEYVTARLIAEASDEIEQGRLGRLLEHRIVLAQAREYVRQTQERLIAFAILEHLRDTIPGQVTLEAHLRALLNPLRAQSEDAQGYAPSNLVTLLRLLRGDLRAVDMSDLVLRSIYLQGVEMQDATLAGAKFQNSVFTETFDAVLSVAVSSAGRHWAAASRSGEVWLWAAEGLILERVWHAHAETIPTLAFSPDERILATGSWDGTLKLWDLESGALLWSGGHASLVKCLVFSPDGRQLASSGNDGIVQLWDAASGARGIAMSHTTPVPAVIWNLDGSQVVTGDRDGIISVWELQNDGTARVLRTLTGHVNWVDALALSPDGSTLSSVGWDGAVRLWDFASGRLLHTLTGHTDWVQRVGWSSDGRTLATCSRDQTIRLWRADQDGYQMALLRHAANVGELAFVPDNRRLISASEDGTLRVWDVVDGQCIRIIQGYTDSLYTVDWSPDGTELVSGGTDTYVTIYSVASGEPLRILRGRIGSVFGVGWSSNGRWLASSGWNKAIHLWDTTASPEGQLLLHPDDEANIFYSVAWSPDGTRLACGTNRRGVLVFEMTGQERYWSTEPITAWIRQTDWRPDGAQLSGGSEDGLVYIWDALSGALVQALAGHQNRVTSIAWSPDGTRLASGGSGSDSGELFLWDTERGERAQHFEGHPGIVYSLAWSPRGDLLVSGGSDGKLRGWDVESGACLWTRDAHRGAIHAIRRSPDGTTLASCGDDGAIMLWNLASGGYLRTLRRDRPYERLNITGVVGLSDAQKATLRSLGAVEDA